MLLVLALRLPAFAQPDCPQPSAAEIHAALLSVYYFAQARPRTLPEAWRPIPLQRAARILRCDRSFAHTSRRRRAAAKLAGGIAVLRATPSHVANMHAATLGVALRELDVPVDDLFMALSGVDEVTRAGIEISAQRFFDRQRLARFAKACCSCLLECVAGSDGELSTVVFKSFVHRQLANLKPILDPQRWDDEECGKGFFVGTSHAGDQCTTASVQDPTTNDPIPGKSWKGVLFEHFAYDYAQSNGSNGTAGLKNFLDIDIEESAPSYVLEYGLCKSLDGSMTNPDGSVSALGLVEDCGFSSAAAAGSNTPNDSHVRGLKRLQFTVPGLRDLTVIGLMVMADMITYDVLCCDAGGEPAPEECRCADKLCGQGDPTVSADAEPRLCRVRE